MSPAVLFTALQSAWAVRFAQWRCADGFASIRSDWLDRAAGLGERIRVRLPQRELAGTFRGLDETGAMLLEEGAGVITVRAGEVFGL